MNKDELLNNYVSHLKRQKSEGFLFYSVIRDEKAVSLQKIINSAELFARQNETPPSTFRGGSHSRSYSVFGGLLEKLITEDRYQTGMLYQALLEHLERIEGKASITGE